MVLRGVVALGLTMAGVVVLLLAGAPQLVCFGVALLGSAITSVLVVLPPSAIRPRPRPLACARRSAVRPFGR